METLNSPESFGDWDTNNDLDVEGHRKKWNEILFEMIIMVVMQMISNIILLLPFFVTGIIEFSNFSFMFLNPIFFSSLNYNWSEKSTKTIKKTFCFKSCSYLSLFE